MAGWHDSLLKGIRYPACDSYDYFSFDTMMSEEEALEVMLLNPAVLQCGPSLDLLGASEIRNFARLRSAGNALVPPQARRQHRRACAHAQRRAGAALRMLQLKNHACHADRRRT